MLKPALQFLLVTQRSYTRGGFNLKIEVDIRPGSVKLKAHCMKSDTTTTVLNFVLVLLAIGGVFFAILTFMRTREHRLLTNQINLERGFLQQMQALVNDVDTYNKNLKPASPELTGYLQPFETKPEVKSATH